MDIRQLKVFSAVAKHGALPAASRELHLTCSALSHALRALESDLNVRLFDRIGRKLLLNQAGEQLLARIRQPLADLDKAAASIQELGRWGQGRIRVGAPGAICQHLMPRVVRELHRAFGKLFISLECGDSNQVLELLRKDRIDLALSIEPEKTPDLVLKPCFEDELLFAFSSEHPWADGRSLGPAEIARQPLVLYSAGSLTGQKIQQFFGSQDIQPMTTMEVGDVTAIKELVKLGGAVALLAPWVFQKELATGAVKMRPLGQQALRRKWALIHRSQRRLGLPEEQFVKLCRREAAALRLDRKDLPPQAQVSRK